MDSTELETDKSGLVVIRHSDRLDEDENADWLGKE